MTLILLNFRSNDRQRSRSTSRKRSQKHDKKDASRTEKRTTHDDTTKRRSRSIEPKSGRADSHLVERKNSETITATEPTQKPVATESVADEKERALKEKMLKRAEALSQFKDHMLKQIEQHGRLQAEKKRQEEEELERARQTKEKDRNETAQEIARLEEIKSEMMLMLQEKDGMNTMEKVLKICAASSIVTKRKNHSSSGSSSSSSSDGDNKKSRSKKQHRRKRSASSSSSSSSSN